MYNYTSFLSIWLIFAPILNAIISHYYEKSSKWCIALMVLMASTMLPVVIYITQINHIQNIDNAPTFLLYTSWIVIKLGGPGMAFCMIISALYPVSLIYASSYCDHNNIKKLSTFMLFFNLAIMSAIGLGMAGNMITALIFYEVTTIVTYPLVVHNRTTAAKDAGLSYIATLISTSVGLLLPCMVAIYCMTGKMSFCEGGILSGYAKTNSLSPLITNILLLMSVFGIAKIGIFPIHSWLVKAMVAPIPVSGLLHAVVVVKAGILMLYYMVYYVFGIEILAQHALTIYCYNIMTWLALISIIYAAIMAIKSDNLKERLAYSTIGQLSGIVSYISIFDNKMHIAIFSQIFAHAVAKLLLFFCAGAIYTITNLTNISQMRGLFKFYKISILIIIAIYSLLGMPLSVGSYAKHHAISSGNISILVIVAISRLASCVYSLAIIASIYMPEIPKIDSRRDMPFAMTASLTALVIMIFIGQYGYERLSHNLF